MVMARLHVVRRATQHLAARPGAGRTGAGALWTRAFSIGTVKHGERSLAGVAVVNDGEKAAHLHHRAAARRKRGNGKGSAPLLARPGADHFRHRGCPEGDARNKSGHMTGRGSGRQQRLIGSYLLPLVSAARAANAVSARDSRAGRTATKAAGPLPFNRSPGSGRRRN